MRKKTASFTIPALWNAGKINQSIDKVVSIFGPGADSVKLMGETALMCLLHAHKHGDVTLCQRLYKGLGGVTAGKSMALVRVEAFKTWLRECTPITATREGKFHFMEGKKWQDQENWNLEKAVSTPFWEIEPERVMFVDFGNFMTILKGWVKKADKAHEEGRFKGDYVAAKELAANVVSFAEKAAEKLTLQQKGVADITEEAVKASVTSREDRRKSKPSTQPRLIREGQNVPASAAA